MAGLVFDVLLPSLKFVAVSVLVPAVSSRMLKLCVPATSAAGAGRIALASDEVNPAVSVIVPTRFQLASTALTVTLNGVSAVSAVGVQVLPVVLPGEAVSPGTNSCSFVKAPAFTVTLAVVYPVNPVALAGIVRVPADFKVESDKLAAATG